VNYNSNFEYKQNNKHLLRSCDIPGIEDKTKTKKSEPHSKETEVLLGKKDVHKSKAFGCDSGQYVRPHRQ
jgi:hypothetical protein